MKTVFISDLHLSESAPHLTEIFLSFLTTLTPNDTHALYILGDFFDVWVGDDENTPLHQKIATALTQVNIPVYFMPGNRDFTVGKKYAARAGMELIQEPYFLTIAHKKFLLMHGDLLCSDDLAYLRYRAIIQHPVTLALLRLLPLSARQWLGRTLRKNSEDRQKNLTMRVDVNLSTVAKVMKQHQCDYLIHGHTHRPGIQKEPGYIRITLDAWHDKGNACVVDDELNVKLEYFVQGLKNGFPLSRE